MFGRQRILAVADVEEDVAAPTITGSSGGVGDGGGVGGTSRSPLRNAQTPQEGKVESPVLVLYIKARWLTLFISAVLFVVSFFFYCFLMIYYYLSKSWLLDAWRSSSVG